MLFCWYHFLTDAARGVTQRKVDSSLKSIGSVLPYVKTTDTALNEVKGAVTLRAGKEDFFKLGATRVYSATVKSATSFSNTDLQIGDLVIVQDHRAKALGWYG